MDPIHPIRRPIRRRLIRCRPFRCRLIRPYQYLPSMVVVHQDSIVPTWNSIFHQYAIQATHDPNAHPLEEVP